MTNKTLAVDPDQGFYMTYSYYTTLEVYEDGTSASYLNGKLILHEVNTNFFENEASFVRISVGWRSP